MNINESKNITEYLLETFLIAGQRVLELRNKGLKTNFKSDNSPVTNADLEVDKLLTEKISHVTPNIPLISEENITLNKNNKCKDFWLLDPIDGTRDFINDKEEFTLNAALIINFVPVIGIIFAPAKDRLFYSYGKDHAFEKFKKTTTEIKCKKKTEPGTIVAVSNSATPSEEILKVHKKFNVKNYVNMRSSLKLCVIASGEFDLYAAKARAYEWDIAAGHAIVQNAGGIVTTLEGENFKYGKADYKNLSLLVRRSLNLEK